MTDIQKRLQTLFQKERIIFWYDDNEALKEEFDSVDIEDVEKRVIENNEFSLKREMLNLKPQTKFLIYSPEQAPMPEDNWLLDLNIANHMFSADKISLILQTLGLDVYYKPFMSHFSKFLNAPSRVEALGNKVGSEDSNDTLILKMISVAIKSDDNVENILYKLFEDEKAYKVLEKFEFTNEFFKIISAKYNYSGDNLTDFLYKLLQNHFYHSIDRGKCTLNSDARLFVNSWMDSSRYKDSFIEHSTKVSEELNIKGILESFEAKKVLNSDTYEKCDQVVISYLLKLLEDGENERITDIIKTRANTFWYEHYKNIYQAILSASKLIDFVKKCEFEMKDFNDAVSKYSNHWYKADKFYREYSVYASNAEKLEVLKGLSTKIEDIYLNGFLRELNDTWQKYFETYDIKSIQNHQQDFYKYYVEPIVENNKKIFVIISDAMRYECGVELASKILQENKKKDRFSVTCKHLVSSLPSYTQLGMASLLPHQELSITDKNDTVFVDGKSSVGLQNRDKILKSYNEKSVAINYEEFLNFSRVDGREFAKNHQIIYIYHDEIDKMGEKNEPKTFDAVNSTFDTLIKTIKQVSNFNGVNIYITSDHGFLFTNQPTLDSEFCSVSSNGAIKLNRRFMIGKDLETTSCVSKFDGGNLGVGGDNEFLIPRSINKIRVQGGGNRFVHGGGTLQELVTPLLEVNIAKNKADDAQEVNVEIFPIRNISTNTVNVGLYQSEVLSGKMKPLTLRICFESIDGQILSDQITHRFESTDGYDTNRESRFKFTFKQEIDAYNNKTIKLVARKVIEGSSELPVYKELETRLVLSFFNDFDDDF